MYISRGCPLSACVTGLCAALKEISTNLKKFLSINKNDYSTSGWKETVKGWDDAVSALKTIHGNVVLTSLDDHVVAYKFENVLQDDHLSQPFRTLRCVWGYLLLNMRYATSAWCYMTPSLLRVSPFSGSLLYKSFSSFCTTVL